MSLDTISYNYESLSLLLLFDRQGREEWDSQELGETKPAD